MTGEPGLIGLLYGADWTRLSLSAEVSDGSAVLVAPGKRYWYRTPDYETGCDGVRAWELSADDPDEDDETTTMTLTTKLPGSAGPSRRWTGCCARPGC